MPTLLARTLLIEVPAMMARARLSSTAEAYQERSEQVPQPEPEAAHWQDYTGSRMYRCRRACADTLSAFGSPCST